ncbi:hypothetical protein D9M68_905440 [compost metagenome]
MEARILAEQGLGRRVVQVAIIGIVEVDLAVAHRVFGAGLLAIHVVDGVAEIVPVDAGWRNLGAAAVIDMDVLLGQVFRIFQHVLGQVALDQ